MPKNRIIYNTQGLFVAPYSGEYPNGNDYYLANYKILKRLEKIQSFNYGINSNTIELHGMASKKYIFRDVVGSPQVTFDFSYIPDGVTNENRLNFDVNHFSGRYLPMFSGLCTNNLLSNNKDFYLVINKDENDINSENATVSSSLIKPTTIEDVIDKNSKNYSLLHFQNCTLNTYGFDVSVGNLPLVTQNYTADNITFYNSGSGVKYTFLDLKSGINQTNTDTIIIPKNLNYTQSNLSGENILLPGDASVTFYTNNSTGVLFYNETIQSLNFDLNFNRKNYKSVNYKFPIIKKIEFPVNGKLNTSFIVEENLSGSFFDTLNRNNDYNIVVNFASNKNDVYPTKLVFSGCKFDAIEYTSNINSNKIANLNFNFDLDPDTASSRGIYTSGNLMYSYINNQKKVLIF